MAQRTAALGAPKTIRVDDGPGFIAKVLNRWAYENGVTLDFSQPRRPTDNAFLESFNGRLRDEGLDNRGSCRWRTHEPRSRHGEMDPLGQRPAVALQRMASSTLSVRQFNGEHMTVQSSSEAASTGAIGAPAFKRKRRGPLAAYMSDGVDLHYEVGPNAAIVAEQDGFYTLYAVVVTASDGSRYRHLLMVPTNVSAVSFDVGLALLEADSIEVDAGCFEKAERLASALKWDYRRYRAFPTPAELNRFCM